MAVFVCFELKMAVFATSHSQVYACKAHDWNHLRILAHEVKLGVIYYNPLIMATHKAYDWNCGIVSIKR